MIRNTILGCGLILYPDFFLRNRNKSPVHLIIVGTLNNSFVKEFMILNPNINCISIGNDEGNSYIDYDFSFLRMQIEKFDYSLVKVPKDITEIFSPQNKYIVISSLIKPYAILSMSIIKYLQNNSIDFRFLGTTSLFNISLGNWGQNFYKESLHDSRLTIFDINEYLTELRQINSDVLAVDAFEMLADKLTDTLIRLIDI